MVSNRRERRLFEIVGVHFRLPVWARFGFRWENGRVRVSLPEMPWLTKQRAVAVDLLQNFCEYKRGDDWILLEEKFAILCVESQWSNPEDVVVWNWIERDIPVEADFILEYCQSRGAVVLDPNFMTLIWASLQKFALWWVLTKNRPLDLGFVKLECVPARRNWLAILAARRAQSARYAVKPEVFIKRMLASQMLNAWDAEFKVIRWDITATPNKHFHKAARLIELQRKRDCETVDYVIASRNVLIAHYQRVHEILSAYMEEAARKNIRLPRRPYHRSKTGKKTKPRQADPPGMDTTFGVVGVLEKGKSAVMASENANLLSVSDILSLCPDMRCAGTNVAKPEEPKDNRTIGLPVLDAIESQTPC